MSIGIEVNKYNNILKDIIDISIKVRALNAVETFRQTAGPWDVDFAKEV